MITYRDAARADGPAIDAMAATCFTQTFGPYLHDEDLAGYLCAGHGPGGTLLRDFRDPAVAFRIAVEGGAVAGYLKLTALRLPAPAPEPGAREIAQLYVLRPWQGKGVANVLMAWAINAAQEAGAPALYLGVYEENARALAFYRRHGFAVVGETRFQVGRQVDRDLVMRRPL